MFDIETFQRQCDFTGELHSQASGPGQCGRIFDPHQEQLVILQRLAAPRSLQSRQ